MPRWKYIANIFLTAFANVVFQRYLTEIHSGFRAYTRKYLEIVRFEENSNSFVFDTEIIAQGMACRLFFTEVPITTRYFKERHQSIFHVASCMDSVSWGFISLFSSSIKYNPFSSIHPQKYFLSAILIFAYYFPYVFTWKLI